jgi:hypothetical protein
VAGTILEGLFEGYNGTIIAYGSTSSGKTYTIDVIKFMAYTDLRDLKMGKSLI